MKLSLIVLFATVAVAVAASAVDSRVEPRRGRRDTGVDVDAAGVLSEARVEPRRGRRDTGVDVDAAEADAGGYGDNVAAQTGVLSEGRAKVAVAAASAKQGGISAQSRIGSLKARKFNEETARDERRN